MNPGGFLTFLVIFGLVVVLPILALVTEHQRKLAEIRANGVESDGKVAQLEAKIAELEERLNMTILEQDDLKRLQLGTSQDVVRH